MAGIFGPDAEMVRQAIAEKQSAEDMQWANMPAGRGMVAGAAKAGRGFGNAIGAAMGYQDPQVAKAKLLEEAKQEVDSSGVNLLEDSKGYYSKAFEALQRRGLMDEAMGIRQLLLSEESTAADTALKTAQADELSNKNRYISMGKAGLYDRETQSVIAPAGAETEKPNSTLGKLKADFDSGLIDKETYDAGVAKATHITEPQDIDVRVDAKNIEDQNKSRNKLAADQAGPILEKGRQSADVLKQTAMLRSQLESGNFDSGFLSTFRGFLGTAGQYLGMDDQLLSDLRQNPNDFNILTSVTQNLVASTATMLQASGQLSKAELELYKASGANMSQTAQGMYAVNEITASIADWNVRRSEKLTELYAQMPEAGTNDMQVINEIQKWERDNPLSVDVKTLDRIKRHAKIVEMGKQAKDIKSAWSPEKGKNTASVGNVYRYRGGLYVYKGDTVVDGKVVPDLRMAK
jgi:hypothetical protein